MKDDDRVKHAEIAKAFGVGMRTVRDRWSKEPDYPQPVQRISQKSVWWRFGDVRAWRAGRGAV